MSSSHESPRWTPSSGAKPPRDSGIASKRSLSQESPTNEQEGRCNKIALDLVFLSPLEQELQKCDRSNSGADFVKRQKLRTCR